MEFKPKRIILIGSGYSLRNGDQDTPAKELEVWNKIQNEFTIGINWIYRYFEPTANLFGDDKFYKDNKKDVDEMPVVIAMDRPKLHPPEGRGKCPVGDNVYLIKRSRTYEGRNSLMNGCWNAHLSGSFLLSIAISLGFEEIYLLGYDFTSVEEGKTHFYNNEVSHRGNGVIKVNKGGRERWVHKTNIYDKSARYYFDAFKKQAERIKIINVSPKSKIDTFDKIDYKEFYEILEKDDAVVLQSMAREWLKQTLQPYRTNDYGV